MTGEGLTAYQQQMLDYAAAAVAMIGTVSVLVAIIAATVLVKVVWQR